MTYSGPKFASQLRLPSSAYLGFQRKSISFYLKHSSRMSSDISEHEMEMDEGDDLYEPEEPKVSSRKSSDLRAYTSTPDSASRLPLPPPSQSKPSWGETFLPSDSRSLAGRESRETQSHQIQQRLQQPSTTNLVILVRGS